MTKPRMKCFGGRCAAFTLVELLVVIAVIMILARLMLPSLGKARQAAYTAMCVSNLRQLHIATTVYMQTPTNGYLYAHGAWLNPQVTEGGSTWNANWRRGLAYQMVRTNKIYWCPADSSARVKAVVENPVDWWLGSYGANGCVVSRVQALGVNGGRNNYFEKSMRNPTEVILYADVDDDPTVINSARRPSDWCPCSTFYPNGMRHNGKGNVVFCDGHAETLTEAQTLSPKDLWKPVDSEPDCLLNYNVP